MIEEIELEEGTVITYFNGFTAMEKFLAHLIISNKDENNVLNADKITNIVYEKLELMGMLISEYELKKDILNMMYRFLYEDYAKFENGNIILISNFN